MKKLTLLLLLFPFVILYSCLNHDDHNDVPVTEQTLDELVIPDGFDWSTKTSVRFSIKDATDGAIYSIYTWYDETENFELDTRILTKMVKR